MATTGSSTTGNDVAPATKQTVLTGGTGVQKGHEMNDETGAAGVIPAADSDSDFGVDERKLLRKLDLHIIPLVMLLYTFSFLDR